MPFRGRQLPPLPSKKDGSHGKYLHFSRNNRLKLLLPPLPTTAPRTCGHLHIDIAPDLWEYRRRLGPQYDEPSEDLIAFQNREREEYSQRRLLQLSNARYDLDQRHGPGPSGSGVPHTNIALASTSSLGHQHDRHYAVDTVSNGFTQHHTSPIHAYPSSISKISGQPATLEIDSTRVTASHMLLSEPLRTCSLERRSRLDTETPQYTNTSKAATTMPSLYAQAVVTSIKNPPHANSSDLHRQPAKDASPTDEQTEDACFKRHDSFGHTGKGHAGKVHAGKGHAASPGAKQLPLPLPLHAPTPQKTGIPDLLSDDSATEDLSGYPHTMREVLKTSTRMSSQETDYSSPGDRFEMYEDYVYTDKMVPRRVVGTFRDRHTANIEAAKLFVHRFWEQVMERRMGYHVCMGDYGLMRMDIALDGEEDGLRSATVIVCKKENGG